MATNEELCLPAGYTQRTEVHYFGDWHNTDKWQNDVYQYAAGMQPESVLDVGCGSGYKLVKYFGEWPRHMVVGVDLPPTLKRLRKEYPDWSWHEMGELGNRKFGMVILADVLEHVAEPVDFLNLCLSHLNMGGFLLASTPDRTAREEFYTADIARPKGPPKNFAHLREWGWVEFECFMCRFGVRLCHLKTEHHGQLFILKKV